ncbi:low temperature requirement protein A [Micromonospora acroterricola]|uniref:Low temperature requirement protein A n=2 Tax=Micromonospora acroterricola TaxID=2202421 RepID=A0A317D2A5_9ACTN|nr:low temperature requirement protein A [Micromonospora acroterricola]
MRIVTTSLAAARSAAPSPSTRAYANRRWCGAANDEDEVMGKTFGSRPVMTAETHRTTLFEIFFDLVFVFALIRVTSFMSARPAPLTLAQGLLVLLLSWISWLVYSWLGNYVRIDVGLVRAGTTVAMAAVFLAALVIPDVWESTPRALESRLILVLAYIVVRVIHLALYTWAAGGDRRLRRTLRLYALSTALSWIPLVLGAVLGGTAQILLWTGALAIDLSGGVIASVLSGWPIRSTGHFTERHSLVVIIALGESLVSVGAGVGAEMIRRPVLLAALLTLAMTVCLYRLYSESAATAGEALRMEVGPRRGRLAANAYSIAHFPLIAGTIYLALGVEQVLARLAHDHHHDTAELRLDWTPAVALFGGVGLYLAGRATFLSLSTRSVTPGQILAPGAALLLIPAGRFLPGLVALGLLTAFLVVLVSYEALYRRRRGSGAAASGRPERTRARDGG